MIKVIVSLTILFLPVLHSQEEDPVRIGDGSDTVLIKTGKDLARGKSKMTCDSGLMIFFDANRKVAELSINVITGGTLRLKGLQVGMSIKEVDILLGKPARILKKDPSEMMDVRTQIYLKDGLLYKVMFFNRSDEDGTYKKDTLAAVWVRKANL